MAHPTGVSSSKALRWPLTSATPSAFFLFLVLLLTLHLILGWCRRDWALQRGELITIFTMMMVASAIPTKGVNGLLMPMITGTFYYATPENDWASQIHPWLPRWILVANPEAVKEFYEGASRGRGIPWAHWLPPLGAWLLLYCSLYLAATCLSVILRRQWVEHERLIYPLMQVPLAMMADDPQGRLVKPFFRNWTMWIGFAIPVVFMSFFALHNYFPYFPQVVLNTSIDVFRQSIFLTFGLNFLMLGFGYFINTQIGFSLWFFYLLHQLQEGLLFYYGLQDTQAELGWWTEPGMGHQMMGALIVLVLSGLWDRPAPFQTGPAQGLAAGRPGRRQRRDHVLSGRCLRRSLWHCRPLALALADRHSRLDRPGVPLCWVGNFHRPRPGHFRDRATHLQSQYDPGGLWPCPA